MSRTQFGRQKPATRVEKKGRGDQALIAAAGRLNDATRAYVVAIVRVHQLKREHKPPPEQIYQQIRTLLSQTMSRCERLSLPPEDVTDVRYALVAFTDEYMQLESGPLREFWQSHLLQLEHFGETRAGEGFFERLETLKEEARRAAVLHVYYVCLLFGFQGIYGQHGELERENLIDDVRQRLDDRIGTLSVQSISPHGPRPDEPGIDHERNRLLQWLAVAAAAMSVFWYIGLLFTVDAQERHLTERLRHMHEDLKIGFVAPAE